MEVVAKKEYRTPEEIRQWVSEGKVAIPANKHHTCLNPEGVGSMLRTKINVNLGVSRDCKDYNIEMQKVMSAVNMGAEAIMDLSSHGNTQPFRQKLTHECPVMIGTVPVYDSVIHYQRDLATLTAQDFIDVVRLHAQDGVDFVTLHCGITRKTIDQIRKHKRKMNIVSRGGSLVFAWMCMTGEENPFYEYYDEILDICREYDVTISLGDACRPGCLADATDVCQIEELVRLGELTKRAWAHNVQVMVEGPGHVPLNQVAANMEVQKSICMGAPFYKSYRIRLSPAVGRPVHHPAGRRHRHFLHGGAAVHGGHLVHLPHPSFAGAAVPGYDRRRVRKKARQGRPFLLPDAGHFHRHPRGHGQSGGRGGRCFCRRCRCGVLDVGHCHSGCVHLLYRIHPLPRNTASPTRCTAAGAAARPTICMCWRSAGAAKSSNALW